MSDKKYAILFSIFLFIIILLLIFGAAHKKISHKIEDAKNQEQLKNELMNLTKQIKQIQNSNNTEEIKAQINDIENKLNNISTNAPVANCEILRFNNDPDFTLNCRDAIS